MKRVAFLLVALSFVSLVPLVAADTQSPSSLTGFWYSSQTRNGIGDTLDFRPDGTCVETITVILNEKYRVNGDQLVFKDGAGEPDAAPEIWQIKTDGAALIKTHPKAGAVRMERIGASEANQPPVVGTWRYRHYTGAIAFERYTPEGDWFLRIPMRASICHYSLSQKVLTITYNDQTEVTTIALNGDVLTLVSQHPDRQYVYRRDPAGQWYDDEHIDYQRPAALRNPPKP